MKRILSDFILGGVLVGLIFVALFIKVHQIYTDQLDYQEQRIIKLENDLVKKSDENNTLREYKKRYEDIKETYESLYKSGQ